MNYSVLNLLDLVIIWQSCSRPPSSLKHFTRFLMHSLCFLFTQKSVLMLFAGCTSPAQAHNVGTTILSPLETSSVSWLLIPTLRQWLPNANLKPRPLLDSYFCSHLSKVLLDTWHLKSKISSSNPPTAFLILIDGELCKSHIYC